MIEAIASHDMAPPDKVSRGNARRRVEWRSEAGQGFIYRYLTSTARSGIAGRGMARWGAAHRSKAPV